MGWIDLIYRLMGSPRSPKGLLKKLAVKGARHWFKHTTVNDLRKAEIYDAVRDRIGVAFRSNLIFLIQNVDAAKKGPTLACIDFGRNIV